MGNSKEGHTTEVDLALENSKESLTRKGKEVKKSKKLQKAKHKEWRRKKDEEEMQRASAKYEEWRRKVDEELLRQQDPEEITDPCAYQARLFEKRWNCDYLTGDSRFEDNTSIPCKRYTVDPTPDGGFKRNTLQVFSVRVTELTGGLQWPLNVFGLVALRDSLDHNRNVIFKRERDNCQTLTNENPYLVLTGPVRGVVFSCPVVFEVLLYVRGTTDSDDKELSLLAVNLVKSTHPLNSVLIKNSYTSRLSTLDFEIGHIVYSVEATISARIISGTRPDCFRARFSAVTYLDEEFVLLDSQDEDVPISGNKINLSRCVVSVESSEQLRISVKARQGCRVFWGEMDFTPQEMGTSIQALDIGFCKMEVTVAWSLFSFART
ncbi:unnamed protein product [Urochloa decumbens]|uniref:DUF6598 domain-containing protein n=1 Tax=Urochloa decumbens TaxID=240449 RepID=A0ABC9D671_9POAL